MTATSNNSMPDVAVKLTGPSVSNDTSTAITSSSTQNTPPALTVACRILRSPSHESVTTDLSLFSISTATAASELHSAGRRLLSFSRSGEGPTFVVRGHSPNPESRCQNRPADIPEILWFEEENDLIRSCAALCTAAGMQKSFSTSDISQLPSPEENTNAHTMRTAVSDIVLSSLQRSGQYILEHTRLDHTSRSCSTWVAVGDVVSTSQLPSPHGGHSTVTIGGNTTATLTSGNTLPPPQVSTPPPPAPPPLFTAADFIRSVNKKVRQNYIRRRLLTTYKALERLSQSEFNLDRIEVAPSTAAASISTTPHHHQSDTSAASDSMSTSHVTPNRLLTVPGGGGSGGGGGAATNAAVMRVVKQRANNNLPLTLRDVERERGKPLSKYERNMMIFNWLHTLDETAVVEGVP